MKVTLQLKNWLNLLGGNIRIMTPLGNDPNGTPMVEVRPKRKHLLEPKFHLPVEPMPESVDNFKSINLSYFDNSVLNFLQQFCNNRLLDNVNLAIPFQTNMENQHAVLSQLAPLIGSINSLKTLYNNPFGNIYDNKHKNDSNDDDEYAKMVATMLAKARVLETFYGIRCSSYRHYGDDVTDNKNINEYCHWLYTPRMDVNPRLLIFNRFKPFLTSLQLEEEEESARIDSLLANEPQPPEDMPWECSLPTASPFINRIKQDFLKATQPASFFIRIVVKRHDHRKNVFLENTKTKEKLVIKAISKHGDVLLLISRHPMDVTNAWIAQNQKEVLDWNFDKMGRQIRLNRILVIGMEMTKDN